MSLTSIGRRWWKWAGDGRGLLRHASSASFSSQCVTDLCQPLLELVPSLVPVWVTDGQHVTRNTLH